MERLKELKKYQRGNDNPSIQEGQTTHWPKEKVQTTIHKTHHRKITIGQHETH
jgi:hypothetical protein